MFLFFQANKPNLFGLTSIDKNNAFCQAVSGSEGSGGEFAKHTRPLGHVVHWRRLCWKCSGTVGWGNQAEALWQISAVIDFLLDNTFFKYFDVLRPFKKHYKCMFSGMALTLSMWSDVPVNVNDQPKSYFQNPSNTFSCQPTKHVLELACAKIGCEDLGMLCFGRFVVSSFKCQQSGFLKPITQTDAYFPTSCTSSVMQMYPAKTWEWKLGSAKPFFLAGGKNTNNNNIHTHKHKHCQESCALCTVHRRACPIKPSVPDGYTQAKVDGPPCVLFSRLCVPKLGVLDVMDECSGCWVCLVLR